MLSAVCFDLDGTLFDDRQYIRSGLREAAIALEEETGTDLHDDLLVAYFEEGLRERTFDDVLRAHDISTDHVPQLVEAYHGHTDGLEPYPYAEPLLRELQEQFELGLLTGGSNGHSKIDRLGFEHYFDVIIVAPSIGMTKQEPAVFVKLLDSLDVSPADAVYIGDNPALDFAHPNALGMYTIRVKQGLHATDVAANGTTPDVTVEDLRDVPKAIAKFE